MGLFDFSILFVDRDFGTYVFCFAYGKIHLWIRFDSFGRQKGWRGFVVTTIT
jgi:hypothetical protein